MKTLHRGFVEDRLTSQLEPWALPYLASALDGDEEAAQSLVAAAGNNNRGLLAVACWHIKISVSAYRIMLSAAWDHDHREVIAAAGTRRRLRSMFRYAAFPLPEMADVVRVWRGTSYLPEKQAIKGYSWTLNRDVACWFAMRFSEQNGKPLVLAADVLKSDIFLYHDERMEMEAVIFTPPPALVDGHPEEWWLGYERYQAEKDARNPLRVKSNTAV